MHLFEPTVFRQRRTAGAFAFQTEGSKFKPKVKKFFSMLFLAFMVKYLRGFSSSDIKAFMVPESRQRLRKYEVKETGQRF
jgi:hypothetical protein